MQDFVGEVIGQYRIEALIGRGGMGDVYLARHERLDRPCALKILRPQLSSDPQLRERFIREAQAAAKLDHPNIVTIYDAGEEDGIAYFAMQLVEGEPLTTLIRSGGVSVAEAITIMRDVAAALDSAHESGMVHRDVKPANIIISPDGTAMLTDFGIVHLRPDAQLTATGQLLGTPAYMSPEQVVGGEITPQTDIYQLAVVAYELLTGALPFRATEPAALLVAHLHEQPVLATERVDNLPAAVATTLNQALHKLPTERPNTASAFVDALDEALSGSGESLRSNTGRRTSISRFSDTTVPQRKGWSRFAPTRWRLGAGIAIVIVVVVSAVVARVLIGGNGSNGDAEGASPTATTALPTPTEAVAEANPQTSVAEPTLKSGVTETPADSLEPPGASTAQDFSIVRPNPDEPPLQGEVVASYGVESLWPPSLEGVSEYENDGIPYIRFEDPGVSITRTTLGANYSDGAAFLDATMGSNPEFYAEICLLARLNASATSGYALCLTSAAETVAYYFDYEIEPGVQVELLAPERRIGTKPPADWNGLEIRAIDDHFWFLINDTLIGSAIHDGRRFGEIGMSAYRDGDQPFDVGWDVLATLQLEPS